MYLKICNIILLILVHYSVKENYKNMKISKEKMHNKFFINNNFKKPILIFFNLK